MHQRFARALRYVARLIVNPDTARTNAAEGSATLAERRQDQERVEEYLQGRLLTFSESRDQERGAW